MVSVKNAYIKTLRYFSKGGMPDFLIVGAQKAGTTSMFHYLNQHPQIIGAYNKEVSFFSRDEHYEKGESWYRNFFKDWRRPMGAQFYFEATPEYMYRPDCANRIYNFNPEMKIIIILRDPVKRAFSAWNMYRDFAENGKPLPSNFESGYLCDRENNITKELYSSDTFPSFQDVVRADLEKYYTSSDLLEPSFIRRGIYIDQVRRFMDIFGESQVRVYGFKDVIGNSKQEILNDVLTFVGIKSVAWDTFVKDDKKNKREYTRELETELMQELVSFYKPFNEELFSLLGKKINW